MPVPILRPLAARLAAVLLLALLAWPSAPRAADYRESFDATGTGNRALTSRLLLGEKDGWRGALADGAYRLENAEQAGSVRYFYVFPKTPLTALEVTVDGRFDGEQAGAGLIYGVDRRAGTYYAFVVASDGRYGLYHRTAEGLRRIAAGSNDAIRADGPNVVRVRFDGGKVENLINDARMMGFGSKTPVEGGVGIVAFDRGSFRFDDFGFSAE